jgi:hypothetical protein
MIDLIPVSLLSFALVIYHKIKKRSAYLPDLRKNTIYLLLLGMAGSFPLALTLVQRDFYLAPAMPFYALGFSLIIAFYLKDWFKGISGNRSILHISRFFSIFLLIGGLIYTGFMIGRAERDQDILHDTYILGEAIGEQNNILLDGGVNDTWSFELYLIRYYNISLVSGSEKSRIMVKHITSNTPADPMYEPVSVPTRLYKLFERKE